MDNGTFKMKIFAEASVLDEVTQLLQSDDKILNGLIIWDGRPQREADHLRCDGETCRMRHIFLAREILARWPDAKVTCGAEIEHEEYMYAEWQNREERLLDRYYFHWCYVQGEVEYRRKWLVRGGVSIEFPYWECPDFDPHADPDPETLLHVHVPTFEEQGYSARTISRIAARDDLCGKLFLDGRAGVSIDLTPDREYGCCIPVDWLLEFAELGDGESGSKIGQAWWYGPPHDQDECDYRGYVKDGILHVEVEVGRELLVRRASLPIEHAFALSQFQSQQGNAGPSEAHDHGTKT